MKKQQPAYQFFTQEEKNEHAQKLIMDAIKKEGNKLSFQSIKYIEQKSGLNSYDIRDLLERIQKEIKYKENHENNLSLAKKLIFENGGYSNVAKKENIKEYIAKECNLQIRKVEELLHDLHETDITEKSKEENEAQIAKHERTKQSEQIQSSLKQIDDLKVQLNRIEGKFIKAQELNEKLEHTILNERQDFKKQLELEHKKVEELKEKIKASKIDIKDEIVQCKAIFELMKIEQEKDLTPEIINLMKHNNHSIECIKIALTAYLKELNISSAESKPNMVSEYKNEDDYFRYNVEPEKIIDKCYLFFKKFFLTEPKALTPGHIKIISSTQPPCSEEFVKLLHDAYLIEIDQRDALSEASRDPLPTTGNHYEYDEYTNH